MIIAYSLQKKQKLWRGKKVANKAPVEKIVVNDLNKTSKKLIQKKKNLIIQ